MGIGFTALRLRRRHRRIALGERDERRRWSTSRAAAKRRASRLSRRNSSRLSAAGNEPELRLGSIAPKPAAGARAPARRSPYCERIVRMCSADALARSLLELYRFRISLLYDPVGLMRLRRDAWRKRRARRALSEGGERRERRRGAEGEQGDGLDHGLSPGAGRSNPVRDCREIRSPAGPTGRTR